MNLDPIRIRDPGRDPVRSGKNSKIRVRSHLCFQLHFKTMLFQIIINSTLMISAKLFEKLAKAVKQNF